MIIKISKNELNLEATLCCGQAFRWFKIGKGFCGVVKGHAIRLEPSGNGIKFSGCNKKFLEQYLRLDDDLDEIAEEFVKFAKKEKFEWWR